MGNPFAWLKEERDAHRISLAIAFEEERKNVFVSVAQDRNEEFGKYWEYASPECWNVNLEELEGGYYCHSCQGWHATYRSKPALVTSESVQVKRILKAFGGGKFTDESLTEAERADGVHYTSFPNRAWRGTLDLEAPYRVEKWIDITNQTAKLLRGKPVTFGQLRAAEIRKENTPRELVKTHRVGKDKGAGVPQASVNTGTQYQSDFGEDYESELWD